jgi:hypothetical protein
MSTYRDSPFQDTNSIFRQATERLGVLIAELMEHDLQFLSRHRNEAPHAINLAACENLGETLEVFHGSRVRH